MWAVAGLGNPEDRYLKTRHNLGFMVLDRLAEDYQGRSYGKYKHSAAAKIDIEGREAILFKPLTYMNRSGGAVREILAKKNIPPEKLIVVQDDIDMETGRIKIRRGGSSGGHKGIESIILELGTADFIRVKVGIGRGPFLEAEKYVLQKFKKEEIPIVNEAISNAARAVAVIITEGIGKAMNRFNKKAPLQENS